MKVYRAFYGWYDTYDHIGIFKDQVDAWLQCDAIYKGKVMGRIKVRSNRRTRYYIVEEELL